jgi:hypothetical protein
MIEARTVKALRGQRERKAKMEPPDQSRQHRHGLGVRLPDSRQRGRRYHACDDPASRQKRIYLTAIRLSAGTSPSTTNSRFVAALATLRDAAAPYGPTIKLAARPRR